MRNSLQPKLTAATILLAATIGVPEKAHALKRVSSQFINLNGEATTLNGATNNATGGAAFYDVTVGAPSSANVLYVSVSGAGDLPQGTSALLLACLVDGNPCNLSKGFNNTGVSGWTVVQSLTSAAQPQNADQNFHYTWCVPITPTSPSDSDTVSAISHSVQLRFASAFGGPVDIEQIYVNVDSEKIKTPSLACTQGSL